MLTLFRRQTAEEREQERQAAAKYFLSMQMSGLDSDSPPSPPPHMASSTAAPGSPSPSPSPSASPAHSSGHPPGDIGGHPQSLNALESLKPWTESANWSDPITLGQVKIVLNRPSNKSPYNIQSINTIHNSVSSCSFRMRILPLSSILRRGEENK